MLQVRHGSKKSLLSPSASRKHVKKRIWKQITKLQNLQIREMAVIEQNQKSLIEQHELMNQKLKQGLDATHVGLQQLKREYQQTYKQYQTKNAIKPRCDQSN